MSSPTHAVVAQELSLHWADGTVALDGLDATFDPGTTGLIGNNGSGKSTLLRLIAGELRPTGGTLTVHGDVGYLPQNLTLATDATVSDLLGVTERRRALHAAEAGDTSLLDVLGDDWDVEERAQAALERLGVPTDLDRTVGTLSGGETVLAATAGLVLRRPAVTVLDEPTNNLDRAARDRLTAAVDDWPGVLIVVSHDRELLEHVDRIAELRDGLMRTFGGTYSAYAATVAAEQEVAARRVRDAEAEVRREKRQVVETQTKLARRERYAHNDYLNKRLPKIVMNTRRGQAEVSAGKYRIQHDEKLDQARENLTEAEGAVRDDDRIRVDLPATAVPAGRVVLELDRLSVRGPERIALVGPNGSGKTTLLRRILATEPRVPVGYLPQRLDGLDDAASVLDNVRAAAPASSPQQVRAGLARFLVGKRAVDRLAGTLSGGERFRVSMAALLLATPPPQLLLLDEPTNNLDLASVAQLTDALTGYRGALIVASHDETFLEDVGVSTRWTIGPSGVAATVV